MKLKKIEKKKEVELYLAAVLVAVLEDKQILTKQMKNQRKN